MTKLQTTGLLQEAHRFRNALLSSVDDSQVVVCRSVGWILGDNPFIGVLRSREILAVEVQVTQPEVELGFLETVFQDINEEIDPLPIALGTAQTLGLFERLLAQLSALRLGQLPGVRERRNEILSATV